MYEAKPKLKSVLVLLTYINCIYDEHKLSPIPNLSLVKVGQAKLGFGFSGLSWAQAGMEQLGELKLKFGSPSWARLSSFMPLVLTILLCIVTATYLVW